MMQRIARQEEKQDLDLEFNEENNKVKFSNVEK